MLSVVGPFIRQMGEECGVIKNIVFRSFKNINVSILDNGGKLNDMIIIGKILVRLKLAANY